MFENLSLSANAAAFGVAALAVWVAGARLARYADKIAEKTGLSRELLGILLLGGITSLPELAVGVSATMAGSAVLSVNDVLGSAAINIVILAVADAIYGRDALTSTPSSPAVLLQGSLGILMLSLVVGAGIASDVLVLGMGAWSWLLLMAFLCAVWVIWKSQGSSSWLPTHQSAASVSSNNAVAVNGDASLHTLLLQTVGIGVVILVAGFILARSGESLAVETGLGTSFFGAVLLGFSTSLPELSTVLAAVRLRRYEMALADVFGTNIFNVAIIVLVDALHPGGPILVEAGRFAAFSALLASLLTALYLIGMIERRNRTVLRMGIDSLTVLVCYGAGVAVLYQLR